MQAKVLFVAAYAALSVNLDPGESIRAEPGAMVHQSNVHLHTGTPGGLAKGLQRLLASEAILIQATSYLASTTQIDIETSFQGLRGILAGEGAFFLRASNNNHTPGTVFFNAYGALRPLTMNDDAELVVDTGHLVAFTNGLEYSIGKVGGLRSLIAGGEGLVMKFHGTGTVWVQTRNLRSLAEHLIPFLPKLRSAKQ